MVGEVAVIDKMRFVQRIGGVHPAVVALKIDDIALGIADVGESERSSCESGSFVQDTSLLRCVPFRRNKERFSAHPRHEVSFLVPTQCVWSPSKVSAPLPSAPPLPGMCDRSLLRLAFAPRPGSPRDAAVRTGRVRLLASFLPESSTKRFCLQREELVCVESVATPSENRFAICSPAQLRDESPIGVSSRRVIKPLLLG